LVGHVEVLYFRGDAKGIKTVEDWWKLESRMQRGTREVGNVEGDFIQTGLLVLKRLLQAIFLTIAIYRGVKMYANGETNRLWSHIMLSVVLGIFVFAPGIAKYLALYVLKTLGISIDGLTDTIGG